jgi:predicted  nucleic acid-binding Zn-ribbon protein
MQALLVRIVSACLQTSYKAPLATRVRIPILNWSTTDTDIHIAMFRESGCVGHFAKLLQEVFPPEAPEARFVAESREKAGWGVLQLLRLFLVRGEHSTPPNQAAFFRAGTAQALLDMSFHPGLPVPIRVAALKSTADLIANNPPIQEQFAALQLAIPSDNEITSQAGSQTNGSRSNATSARNSARPSAEKTRAYVIEALLDSALDQPRGEASLRAAACALIQAYLGSHDRIKNHFLQRAISGYQQGEEAANVLTSLLQPGTDALGVLFASWIVQDLLADISDAKQILAAVKEGNESEGEEVLTAVQALGSQLETAMQTGAEERVIASYASTLVVFLWDFAEGVDDLLAEGSGLIQALVASVSSAGTAPTTAGLAASLLGTVYEFSTKDSPISRRTLAPLLTQKLGRGKYLGALLALRRDPVIRDFGIEEPNGDSDFVNATFVDLFQTEYTRLRKAIDKDPGIEVLPFDDVAAGVDRDVLDDLRQQLQTVKDALTQSEQVAQQSGQQAEHDKMALQKNMQSATAELDRLRKINDAMQRGHEEETTKMQSQHQREKEGLNVEHSRAIASARQEADRQARQAHQQQEQGFAGRVQEYERKLAEMGNAHRTEQTGHNTLKQQIETLRKQHTDLSVREQGTARQLQDVTKAREELGRAHQVMQTRVSQTETELEQLRKEMSERDAQIESLESRLKDLQDDLTGKEQELATERAGFADLEKELETARASSDAKAASDKETAGRIETLEKELESAMAASEAKTASDSENSAKIEKLETMSKNLAGKVKELQEELKTSKQANEASDLKLKDAEKKRSEAVAKSAQSVKDAEKKAKDAAEKSLKEAEKKVQDAEKKAKDAVDKAKKASVESGNAANKKNGAQQASKKDAEDAAKAAETAKKEVEAAKKDAGVAKEEVTVAKAAAEAAKKAADAATAAEKEAREELESLVLVIEDIEKKRDEYKGKVRELGGEVSEDDEDSEDEDDDEGEGDVTLD